MKKAHIATIGFFGLATLGYSGFLFYEHSQLPTRWKQLTPLNTLLFDQGNTTNQTTFESGYTEPHYLTLYFPKKSASQDANATIVKWNGPGLSRTAKPQGPDIQWQLFERDKLVAAGTGEQISAWIGQSIAIGQFQLKSGHQYTLVTKIGPKFKEFLACEPRLGVEVATAAVSIGLAIDRDLGMPFSIGVGSIGLVLLLVAIGNYLVFRKRAVQKHT